MRVQTVRLSIHCWPHRKVSVLFVLCGLLHFEAAQQLEDVGRQLRPHLCRFSLLLALAVLLLHNFMQSCVLVDLVPPPPLLLHVCQAPVAQ